MEKLIDTHRFNFSPTENSGEGLTLETQFFHNGDPGGVFMSQTLTLQSYGNSASFTLCGINLTPDMLRQLASEMESSLSLSKEKVK